MRVQRIAIEQVTKGQRITELDTPEGPFYPVIKVNAKSIVVDASEEWDDVPLPLRLPVAAGMQVLLAA